MLGTRCGESRGDKQSFCSRRSLIGEFRSPCAERHTIVSSVSDKWRSHYGRAGVVSDRNALRHGDYAELGLVDLEGFGEVKL